VYSCDVRMKSMAARCPIAVGQAGVGGASDAGDAEPQLLAVDATDGAAALAGVTEAGEEAGVALRDAGSTAAATDGGAPLGLPKLLAVDAERSSSSVGVAGSEGGNRRSSVNVAPKYSIAT